MNVERAAGIPVVGRPFCEVVRGTVLRGLMAAMMPSGALDLTSTLIGHNKKSGKVKSIYLFIYLSFMNIV